MGDAAGIGQDGEGCGCGACAFELDFSGVVGGMAGVAASEDVGDESAWLSRPLKTEALGLEEGDGRVDRPGAAQAGECRACDV